MNFLLTLFFLVLALEAFLSHQQGDVSGEESRMLAEKLHMNEGVLRTATHVAFFSVLSLLAVISVSTQKARLIVAVSVAVWAFVDEWTKGFDCFPGRHFSWKDVGWNFLGWGMGIAGAVITVFAAA